MKIKRLLSQILANRKNRLLYIVDASWEIFILLFPVWFILSNGKARLAETLGGNRDLASILICLTQLSMIYAEKVIEYSARDCAARPLKLSIHSGEIEHACRRR